MSTVVYIFYFGHFGTPVFQQRDPLLPSFPFRSLSDSKAEMRAHDQRIQFAMERREDAIESYKRNDLIGADEAYGEVIQMVTLLEEFRCVWRGGRFEGFLGNMLGDVPQM